MLIYNPAYDIHHCIFRIYNILHKIKFDSSIEFERVRIIDFHLVFPSALDSVEYPTGFRKIKNKILKINSPYRNISNKYVTFQTMQNLQIQAIDFLKTQGYIEIDNLNNITKTSIFPDLKINLNQRFFVELDYEDENIIMNFFYKTSLNGANSLKKRTRLLEYRYD